MAKSEYADKRMLKERFGFTKSMIKQLGEADRVIVHPFRFGLGCIPEKTELYLCCRAEAFISENRQWWEEAQARRREGAASERHGQTIEEWEAWAAKLHLTHAKSWGGVPPPDCYRESNPTAGGSDKEEELKARLQQISAEIHGIEGNPDLQHVDKLLAEHEDARSTLKRLKKTRYILGESLGERGTFTGTFERFGTKQGYRGTVTTVLLLNIEDADGKTVADHLWFNLTVGFEALSLQPGDKVQFDARVREYAKGYFGRREDVFVERGIDYKLSHPTKVMKLEKAEVA